MNVKFCNMQSTPISSCIMHSHKYWEVILNLSGTVCSVIGNKEYNISKGDIMIIPPHVMHGGKSDNLYTDIYVQCENMDFSNMKIIHDYDGCVLELMNMLHRTFTQKDNSYKLIADSLMDSIAVYLKKYAETEYKYEFVNDLKNEIYANFSNSDFSILDFSANLGLNIDYLRRCFKAETGKTPLEYLTYIRLNYAKGLLRQESFISIVDVSEKCGFSDSFYFSRLFKQHFNVSPLNYRKKYLS